jgi:hypothetical protein
MIMLFCWSPQTSAGSPQGIKYSHRERIQIWLNAHPIYRLAKTDDCQCFDDIKSLRQGPGGAWKPQPLYEPYYATGDFDGGGAEDVAVVVLPSGSNAKIMIVVFFGEAMRNGYKLLEIPHNEKSIAGLGLFARQPTSKTRCHRWKLLFGAFGSEAEDVVIN